MATILCIETATKNCSVSLGKSGNLVDLIEDKTHSYSHAEKLHVFIKEILERNNLSKSQIDAIAVSEGPGSYTGLRIGVSAAKGLCFAWDKPLIAVSTLQSLANQINQKDGYIVAMLDARRMEVYAAVYDQNKHPIRNPKAEIINPQSFLNYLESNKVYFIGDGTIKFKEICTHPNAIFIENKIPSAREMVALATYKYQKSNTEDVAYFEPYYLKEFFSS